MIPIVRAALICEKVLTETDGAVSAIRIMSRIEIPPAAVAEATLLLMLSSTEISETPDHQILMSLTTGQGDVLGRQQFPIAAPPGAGQSFSLILPFRFQAPDKDGTVWLEFAYDTLDQVLARVPLQLAAAT